jgi:3-methyladenine DNA glycosylase AlkD
MTAEQIIANLKQRANAQAVEGMARFGIRPAQALGISMPTLRKMAKAIGRNQVLALALWDSGEGVCTAGRFCDDGRIGGP